MAGRRLFAGFLLCCAHRVRLCHLTQRIEAATVDFLEDLNGISCISKSLSLLSVDLCVILYWSNECFASADLADTFWNDIKLAVFPRPLRVTVDLRQTTALTHRLCYHRVAWLTEQSQLLIALAKHRRQFVRLGRRCKHLVAVKD